ncbi:MAG: Asp-tRNA(Asn)/Glu-tRNA(Gln) amidotransferase GatCAB subunit C [Roseibacillus sp.]|nr:Asp-tRNA(Asn)/Glu-tRNA(Gln) amidotransferase GatCAB subunit C [Roseibacillus sp.]
MDVRYTADLARLSLTDEEVACFQQQFGDILTLVDTLATLDVRGVEPTAHPASVLDIMREDEVEPGLIGAQVLENAPDNALSQIRVPKVVDA